MKRYLILGLTLCLIAGTVLAQTPEPDDDRMMMQRKPVRAKLNLSDEQKKTMSELRLQNQKEMIPLRADMETRELDLKAAMMADVPNMGKINALVDDIAQIKAAMQKKQIANRLKMREMLTPEQREIWDAQKDRRMRAFPRGRTGGDMRPPRAPRI